MATFRVLAVHGIGDHHTDVTWQDQWRAAISTAIRAWEREAEVQVEFMMYDDLFAEERITFTGSLEALAKLLGSRVGDLLRRRRGFVDDLQNAMRWYAGMVVQWVENETIRRKARRRLAETVARIKPAVVCGHSLGSLVCYDAYTHPETQAGLRGVTLTTLGSQIANPYVSGNFLAGRIQPIPDTRWYNLYNAHDDMFVAPIRLSSPFFKQIDTSFDIEGWADHSALGYLSHSATAAQFWSEIAGPQRFRTFVTQSKSGASRLAARPTAAVRRALLVGINDYPDASSQLEGCVNDVFLVSAALQECNFAPEDIRVLLDNRATAQGIRERLEWLLDGASDGDQLVFYYSGHGAQLPTYGGGDVVDKMDETLVPYDFDWSPQRCITDDQIYELYSQLPYGVQFLIILDCCHSGGLARAGAPRAKGIDPPDDIRHRMLRWNAELQMWQERDFAPLTPQFTGDRNKRRALIGADEDTLRLGRATPLRPLTDTAFRSVCKRRGHRGPYMPVIMQACQENQLAFEYRHGVTSHGAFTFALVTRLRSEAGAARSVTFRRLIELTGQTLRSLGYDQQPEIAGPTSWVGAAVPWWRNQAAARRTQRNPPRRKRDGR
jgi:hypothetical protein